MGTLFVSVMWAGFLNFQMIIPTFMMERPVMWRERASALYSVFPWVESMQVRTTKSTKAPQLYCRYLQSMLKSHY
jgi:hypothetical protein